VLVENNVAFNNGSHGFIISRGCNNFVIRNNKSYNNFDHSPTSLAHGFMLDPGSPNSEDPQAPSFNNLLENNEAYGNEGYALRVLGSNDNEIRNNLFRQNQQEGVVIDQNSLRNLVVGNRIINNVSDGLDVRETADGNTIANNIISENGVHGVYIRSNSNVVSGNQVEKNLKDGIVTLPATGVPFIQDNQLLSNTISMNGENGIDLRRTIRTLVEGNVSEGSGIHGIYLSDSAGQNVVVRNMIRNNNGHGIRANGLQTIGNTWSQNQIYGNLSGGIVNTSGANRSLMPPQLLNAVGSTVTGKTAPGYTVEIFSDLGQQGQIFEGSTIADGNGDFSLTISGVWRANNLTGVAIDTEGNASAFGATIAAPIVATPTPTGSVTPTATPTATIIATEPVVTGTPTPTNTPDPSVTLTPTPIIGADSHGVFLPLIRK
jgi:parallel beta-helix repeat protein